MDEGFIKRLAVTMKCGVCGERYRGENVEVLGHRDDLWFMSVFCPACGSQGLVAAAVKEGEVLRPVTDISEKEQAKFCNVGPVSADELLDIHVFLKDFDGDFSRLLSRE
jgi:hypothetical protein